MKFSYRSNRIKTASLAIAIVTFLGGCGMDPSEQLAKDRLEQARTAYAQANDNQDVQSYALKSLLEAEQTLKKAEQINTKLYTPGIGDGKPNDSTSRHIFFEDIAALSYVSERQSQTAEALAEGVVTRNKLVVLEKEKVEAELQKSQLMQAQLKKNLDEKAAALELEKQKLSQAKDEAERAKILAEIHAKEAELAKAELAQLMQELSELQGQLTDRGIVLTIGDVLFSTGKADLNASAQRSMDKLADFLRKKQNRNLLVEGHTDSVGDDEYNVGLSERRATSVKNALIKRDIAPERIATVGYGKKFPIADNATASGKQQNRRVEVIILNEGINPESQIRQ